LKEYHNLLTPRTAGVLTFLSEIPGIKNFTLVGGSALSIHLQLAFQDLDFYMV
jgi:hypothetical protein